MRAELSYGLNEGIDFDAPDGDPVDLIFGLVVPQECTGEHIDILATLARLLSAETLRQSLRRACSPGETFALLTDGKSVHHPPMKLVLRVLRLQGGRPGGRGHGLRREVSAQPLLARGLERLDGQGPRSRLVHGLATPDRSMVQSLCAFLRQWVPAFEGSARACLTVASAAPADGTSVFVAERIGAA